MSVKEIPTISDQEMEILVKSADDPNIFFDYFFRKEGADRGWQLDYNFRPGGEWQKRFATASETFIVAIAGVSTGKSVTVGLSSCWHAMLTQGYKFMNVARELGQSLLMHEIVIEHARDTPFEKFIINSPTKPYPIIVIAYKYRGRTMRSTLQFMSLGEKGDAKNIFSWRGDHINIEEASRIENLSEIVQNLTTRLTGATADGRTFRGMMSLISNPDDNPELWQMYDKAADQNNPEGLVFEVNTEDNKNTTEKQVRAIIASMTDDEDAYKFLTGKRPEGKGIYFSKDIVNACQSETLSIRLLALKKEKKAIINELPSIGIWNFEIDPDPARGYIVVGDPGIGAAPARNAPTLLVFDITDTPKMVNLVAMWWGNGGKSIYPFIDKLFGLIDKYQPLEASIDSTATQKNMAELLNIDYIDQYKKLGLKINVPYIMGNDFSGGRKPFYLVSLRLMLTSARMMWPACVYAPGTQLRNYDPEKDKGNTSKIPQDIVACLAMAAARIRALPGYNDSQDGEEDGEGDKKPIIIRRSLRAPTSWHRDGSRSSR